MIGIGTSGYYFLDWKGSFYPDNLPKSGWLPYYSEHFSILEINRSYYGIPNEKSVSRWINETPTDFRFFVKLHKDTTHAQCGKSIALLDLLDVLKPLRVKGKLSGLLAQFPASFHNTRENRQYVQELLPAIEGIDLYTEFRHKSWDLDTVVTFCCDIGAHWVIVDQPKIRGLSDTRLAVTGKNSYVRFHGRNAHTWYHPERGDRYDWEYSEAELKPWKMRLKTLEERAETTYLFFNNCHAGQAIKSAYLMKKMLENQFEVF